MDVTGTFNGATATLVSTFSPTALHASGTTINEHLPPALTR